jgi:hypothetical protein
MGTQLYGGSLGNAFAGSMAAEIDTAFTALRAQAGKPPVPDDSQEDLQLLFIAIARGVINHLKANEQAFAVNVDGTHPASGFPTIGVKPSP